MTGPPRTVADRTWCYASGIGVETSSFGIAIGSGAAARYPDLPVSYLVDLEGPHDNRMITFYDAGRETAVCGHWSTVTDLIDLCGAPHKSMR